MKHIGEINLSTKSAAAVTNNSIFMDVADNIVKIKDNTGAISDISNGMLGEVRQFALSIAGALTKSALQNLGWAICDGTTPAAQGISSPTIVTTPDMQDQFISMSNDETSGSTGGSATTAYHTDTVTGSGTGETGYVLDALGGDNLTSGNVTDSITNLPPFYELVFFLKVK